MLLNLLTNTGIPSKLTNLHQGNCSWTDFLGPLANPKEDKNTLKQVENMSKQQYRMKAMT